MAEIKDKKLFVDGYAYVRSRSAKGRIYWDCRLVRLKECTARAITNEPRAGEDVVVFKGPETSEHQHPPNRKEVQAIQLAATLKRKVAEHPGQPPTQIMRDKLACVSTAVLSQLPEREALSKTMRRERRTSP